MAARFQVDKFDGKGDFVVWRMKMKALLMQEKVAKALEGRDTLLETMTKERVQEMDEIAYSTVILHLADNVLRQIGDVQSAVELWERLEQLFFTKSCQEKRYLKERFFGYRMDPSKNLEENLEEFTEIVRDLSNIGEEMSDENQAVILLNSLPDMFSEVKTTFIHGRDSLTLRMVLDELRAKDMEMKERRKDGKKCYHCQKEGHFRRNCLEFKNKEKCRKEWVLSSGCSFHMTPNKDYMFDLEQPEGTIVLMGNYDHQCTVEGIGSVKIKTNDGQIRILSNVRYVPNLKRNLISLGALDQNGCTVKSEQGIMKVYKGSSLKLKGRLTDGLYIFEGSTITGDSAKSSCKQ